MTLIKRIELSAVAVMLMLSAAWLAAGQATAGHKHSQEESAASLRVSWADFKKQYDAKTIVVIDVRSTDSFEASHIPGARSIPLEQIEKRAAELKTLKRRIVLYCA